MLSPKNSAIEAGVKRFVYGGSLLIYDSQEKPIGQDTQPRPRSDYGKAKLHAENRLKQMGEAAGIQFTSLRLPHVYGAQSLLFHQMRQGRIMFPGSGDNLFGHLHVMDAARALIHAAESGMQGIFVVADDLSCAWNDFFEMAQGFYPKLKVFHIPKWIALLATGVMETLLRYKQSPNRYSTDAVVSWNLQLPVESNTLTDALDLEPRYPTITDGIPAVLDECIGYTWQPSNLDP